jgi:hypothetical protein
MPVFHILALPIPHGVSSGQQQLSVFFAPRLREPGNIDQYPDIANWPTRINQLAKVSAVSDAGTVTAVRNTPVSPSQAVWNAVFATPESRRVVPWGSVERSGANVTSSLTHRMSSLAEQMLKSAVEDNRSSYTKAEFIAKFAGLGQVAAAIAPFYRPVGNGATPSAATIDLDFHEAVGMLGSNLDLLRRLGLVVDYRLLTNLPSSAKTVSLQFEFQNGRQLGGLIVPVQMRLAPGFLPASNVRSYSVSRFLELGNPAFQITQVDPTSVAGQLAELAEPLTDSAVPSTTPIEVPTFSDGGLSVVQTTLKKRLTDRFEANIRTERGVDSYIRLPGAGTAPQITFADVVSGLRLDVQPDPNGGGKFHSLHERRSPDGYEFPRDSTLRIEPGADEGWSSVSMATDGTPRLARKRTRITYGEIKKRVLTDNTKWRVSDQILIWNGWSLSAPKPSKSTTGGGAVESRDRQTNSAEYPANVVIDYKPVAGSLPRLRYGSTYRLRVRQADITGGGPTLETPTPRGAASSVVQYGRFAPVSAPLVVRRVSRPDPGVGDEPDTIVILSDLGQSTNTIASTDRLVFPPSVAQSVAERHGLPGDGTDPTAYDDLAARDATSLSDQCIVDPDTNEPVAGDALVDGEVTRGALRQPIEYLADPMAAGVAAIGFPAQTAPVKMDHGTWPTLEAIQVQLSAGTAAPAVNVSNRSITAYLPPGTTHMCAISHVPAQELIPHMRGFQLLSAAGHAARDAEIAAGLNEAISRRRMITLVHAVRQPIIAPNFPSVVSGVRPANAIGETRFSLSGTVGVHRQTSDHLALSATWIDPIDDRAAEEPGTQPGTAFIGDLVVPLEGSPGAVDIGTLTFDLDDTRRRTITIASEAFCRYSRYFTKRRRLAAVAGATTVLDAAGVSATDIEVSNRNTKRVFIQGDDYTVDPVAGSITVVSGGGIPVGAPLLVTYLPRPFSRLSTEAPSQPTTSVVVPSTVAPMPPVVRAIVPANQRTVTSSSTQIDIVNDGRVLRLLLERPWYSSGEEEKLAVVVDPAGSLNGGGTLWGRDPILAPPAGVTTQPTRDSFPRASSTDTTVDGGLFDVAAHEVEYDNSRNVWISDVLVDATFSYRPFVQLVVARYQGVAVEGAHMSTVVSCVPARIGARRQVSVVTSGARLVNLTVSGPDSGANTMTVQLQQDNNSTADPLTKWVDVGAPITLTRTGTSAAATFTALNVPTTGTGDRRLIIEESEPIDVQSGVTLAAGSMVVFREIVDLRPAM